MLHLNARKDVVAGTNITTCSINIPDPPGLNDNPGLSNLVIDSVRGCLYVAASAVVTITLKWNDPSQGSNPQFMVLGTVSNSSAGAAQVGFQFNPLMDVNGLAIPAPFSGTQIFVSSNGAGQTLSVSAANHIFVNYHYE